MKMSRRPCRESARPSPDRSYANPETGVYVDPFKGELNWIGCTVQFLAVIQCYPGVACQPSRSDHALEMALHQSILLTPGPVATGPGGG